MLCHYSTVITPRQLNLRQLLASGSRAPRGPDRRANLASLAPVDLLLALDAGTTGVRALAFDARRDRVLDAAHRELTAALPRPRVGRARPRRDRPPGRRRPGRGRRGRARARGDARVALGITNQRETTVALDRVDGARSRPAIVWQDRRTAGECAAPRRGRGTRPRVREATGLVLDPYFSATKMRWLLDHGALDAATDAGARDGRHLAALAPDRRGRRRRASSPRRPTRRAPCCST